MKEFQISTRHTGTKRVIKVMVYDTLAQLKRATRKRDGFYGVAQDPGWYKEMAATANCIEISHDDGETYNPYVTLRFARDSLHGRPTEIIAHESTHAALFLYKHDVQKTMDNIEEQEILCYLVGEITRRVVNKMYEIGVLS